MLKRHALCVAALFVLSFFAAAAEPRKTDFVVPGQTILGAEKPVKPGKLVRLRVSPVGEKPQHLASTSYTWKVYEQTPDSDPKELDLSEIDDLMDREDGSVFFGSGTDSKKLMAQCVVTHLYLVKGGDGKVTEAATRTVLLTTKVTIGEKPKPPTPPVPPPTPTPTPTFPDGQYKLSANAWKWATDKVSDAKARTDGSRALAKSYRDLAASIAAGADKDLLAALKKSKPTNNAALTEAGVEIDAWDAFGEELQDYVYNLYTSKKLNTAADLGLAWLEVAAGLEKVK